MKVQADKLHTRVAEIFFFFFFLQRIDTRLTQIFASSSEKMLENWKFLLWEKNISSFYSWQTTRKTVSPHVKKLEVGEEWG